MGFSYLAQCHAFPGARVLLPALALAAPIEAILHANNARDVEEDAAHGVRTVAQVRTSPRPPQQPLRTRTVSRNLPPTRSGADARAASIAHLLRRSHGDAAGVRRGAGTRPPAPSRAPLPLPSATRAASPPRAGPAPRRAAPEASRRAQAWRRSALGALPLLAAPLAGRLVATFRRGDFVDLPKKTAKFQAVLGALMIAAALLPSPPLSALVRQAVRAVQRWPLF